MSVTLICNDPKSKGCHWSGTDSELVSLTDDLEDNDFSFCPQCEGDNFDEEEDDDDEDDE